MDILYLAHRIPFPPNKGDKIRSFHLLRALSREHRVHLGAFVDSPDDWREAERLKDWCVDVRLEPLSRATAGRRALGGLLRGEALSVAIYDSPRLASWIAAKLDDERIGAAVVFSSAMAQYLVKSGATRRRTIVDFVDVDSDKWRQYAQQAAWPLSSIYRREARLLLRYERAIAAAAEASVFVSDAEARHFRELAPESASRVHSSRNGVDTAYFDAKLDLPDPFTAGERAIVFSGAMDYRANVDAVDWFARAILPRVRAEAPDAHFYIVGTRPATAVRKLAALPGVTVTGQVPDVRPYLAHARVAVAPLRTARGVQNKILEALAMNCPVVCTTAAGRGLDDDRVPGLRSVDTEEGIATAVLAELGRTGARANAGREYVLDRYDWNRNLEGFRSLLLGDAPRLTAQRTAHA